MFYGSSVGKSLGNHRLRDFYQFSDPERLRILEDVKAGKLPFLPEDFDWNCVR